MDRGLIMENAKHTPGPWEHDGYSVEGPDSRLVCNMSGWKGAGVTEANARLIAAAPEMRDALRSIIFQVIQGKVLERDACITQARAVLAKAEGR